MIIVNLQRNIVVSFLFFGIGVSPSAGADDGNLPAASRDAEIVNLDKLSVTAAKFQWQYAPTEHFEVITYAAKETRWIAQVVQKTEHLINLLSARHPLFNLKSELPIGVIYIDKAGIERFDAATDNRTKQRQTLRERLDIPRPPITLPRSFANSDFPLSTSSLQQRPSEALFHWTSNFKTKGERMCVMMHMDYTDDRTRNERLWVHANDLFRCYLYRVFRTLGLPPFPPARNQTNDLERGNIYFFHISSASYASQGEELRFLRYSLIALGREIRHLISDKLHDQSHGISQLENREWGGLGHRELGESKRMIQEFMDRHFGAPLIPLREMLEKPPSGGFFFMPEYGTGVFRKRIPVAQGKARVAEVEEMVRSMMYNMELTDFINYCLFGPEARNADAWVKLMLHARRQPVTEPVFNQLFGMGYEPFFNKMYAFYRGLDKNRNKYNSSLRNWGPPEMPILTITKAKLPDPANFQQAQRGQSARLISDWFAVANRQDLARATLLAAEKEAPWVGNDPEFNAALGLNEARFGDKARALALLEKATVGCSRPDALRTLSKLLLENIQQGKDKDYKLSESEFHEVMRPLLTALKHPRPNLATCLQIITTMAYLDDEPPAGLLRTLAECCASFFPDNFDLLERMIPLLVKNGQRDVAKSLLDTAGNCVLTPDEAEHLKTLSLYITQN